MNGEIQSALARTSLRWAITGVAGFIGSNLLQALLTLDQEVIGVDNFATGRVANLDDVRAQVSEAQWKKFTFVEGDVRDIEVGNRLLQGIDLVLHQAALGSVPRSISDPLATHQANVNGFLNVLIAARDADVQRVIYASSSSVYGDHPGLPKVEAETGNLLSPYALTKSINEQYAAVFQHTYKLDTIGLRYFNVFGRRQDPKGVYAAVIPLWIGRLMQGTSCTINGDGATSRDFCFIANVIQANILAALTTNSQAVNQVYNIAVGERTTLQELYYLLRDELIALRPAQFHHLAGLEPAYADFRPGDVRHSLADISKAKSLLGYDPQFLVQDGIRETLEWYVDHSPIGKPIATNAS